jgi:ABC-2 type transport system permease protein
MNTFADSMTMFQRYLMHLRRYPALSLYLILTPVAMLLLFVYVFGGTLGSGIGGSAMAHPHMGGGRQAYVGYVAPGILMLTISGAAAITAIAVAKDMTEGIIARFRTMAISRTSVLTGHVLGGVVQIAAGVAIMIGLTIAVGFRPHASVLDWLGFTAIVLMLSLAVTWLGVAMGLAAKSVETASNTPMLLTFLPFLGSSFVPTGSLPTGLRGFAEYQPFTPANEAIRALLSGGHVGDRIWVTAAWCAGMALLGFAWARVSYQRDPAH